MMSYELILKKLRKTTQTESREPRQTTFIIIKEYLVKLLILQPLKDDTIVLT